MSFASIHLIGHVGQDPETRQAGAADVCTVSLAVNRKRGNEEFTDWYKCITFYEKNIKLLEDFVHRGSKLFIVGQPAQQKWEDRDGVERLTMEVLIDKIQLLDPPPAGAGRGEDRGRGRDDDRGRGRADAPRGRDDDRGGARRDDRRDDRGRGSEGGTRATARDERGRDDDRGRGGRDDDRGRGGRDAPASRAGGGGGGPGRGAPGWDLDDEIPFAVSK